MKPTAYLFLIPLLFFSILSCKKSDDALARIKPKTVMGIDDTPDNIRVYVQNLIGNEPYARVVLLAIDQFGPEIEYKDIPTVPGTSSLMFFTLLPGTPYCVKIIDNSGAVTYTTPTVASNNVDTYIFPIPPTPAPPVPPVPPMPPIPSTPVPDDSPTTGEYIFKAKFNSFSGAAVAEVAIMTPDLQTALKTKMVVSSSAGGTLTYKNDASFSLAPGTTFRVRLRDETGLIFYTGQTFTIPPFSGLEAWVN